MDERAKAKRRLQFSLAVLLFVVLCVAGTLAGYLTGFDFGYSSGTAAREDEKPISRVYAVDQLIASNSRDSDGAIDYDALLTAITTTVRPDAWEALGGVSTISVMPDSNAIAVNTTPDVHSEIEDFFGDLEEVTLAMKEATSEDDQIALGRQAFLEEMSRTAKRAVGESVTLVSGDFNLSGIWDIRDRLSVDSGVLAHYNFVDGNTAIITDRSDDFQSSREAFYFFAAPNAAIAGTPYVLFETETGAVVLVNTKDTAQVLIAQ